MKPTSFNGGPSYLKLLPKKDRFNSSLLPRPLDYYRREVGELKVRRGRAQILCPFHQEKNPSCSINIKTGGFVCFACGAKGSDVLAFHMRRYGQSFKEAAKNLGAWEEY